MLDNEENYSGCIETSIEVTPSSSSWLDVFLTCCIVAIVGVSLYDIFIVKPKYIESYRVLSEALDKSTDSRDRNTAQYKVLDASLKESMKLIKL